MALTTSIDIKTLQDLASNERERINLVSAKFEAATGLKPSYIIKAPGRINLIGDHIDYHGFSVLPMAIENAIVVCLTTTNTLSSSRGDAIHCLEKNRLVILNADDDLYPSHECEHSFSHGSSLDCSHQWHNYVICGYHGVLARELLQLEASQIYNHAKRLTRSETTDDPNQLTSDQKFDGSQLAKLDTMFIYVYSDLPPASGLSSSSALVCASALATRLVLWDHQQNADDISIRSESLAEDCAKFEQLVGTHGGGMDQAVILTAQGGYAKHIEFMPRFKCGNVRLPRDVVWLVSHCGQSYPKAATSGFNSRVLETKLAAALIIKKLKPSSTIQLDHTITLYKVKDELVGPDLAARDFLAMLESSMFNILSECNFDEICHQLGMTHVEVLNKFNTSEEFLAKSDLANGLKLYRRTKHVLEEADRVSQFKFICETSGDVKQLGAIMTASHVSLRDDYECSHEALDNLVDIALEAGALGARLTGAGWGGCVVSLAESHTAQKVMSELKKASKFTFQTEPQPGASIIKL